MLDELIETITLWSFVNEENLAEAEAEAAKEAKGESGVRLSPLEGVI